MPQVVKSPALLLITGTISLGFTCPAAAQTIDCGKAMTTVELNFCADKEYQTADKALNDTYQMAIKSTRARNMEKPYDAGSFEEALRAAQRAWVAYREAQCKGVVPQVSAGGTITTSAVLGCMTTLTLQRTKELKDDFADQ
ncbi:MAG: DUF1311 domain-containing protein [Hyphomicrobium sp.]|uniref:lysozyme inhibitor LprI family protein n=1 Tax=Hyphomicrobium sp. TaxID=82 RepID=UPI0039E42C87